MKDYERAVLTVTEFNQEDVITTSGDVSPNRSPQVRNGNSLSYSSGASEGTNAENWTPWIF